MGVGAGKCPIGTSDVLYQRHVRMALTPHPGEPVATPEVATLTEYSYHLIAGRYSLLDLRDIILGNALIAGSGRHAARSDKHEAKKNHSENRN
jgi:hypothetical protein